MRAVEEKNLFVGSSYQCRKSTVQKVRRLSYNNFSGPDIYLMTSKIKLNTCIGSVRVFLSNPSCKDVIARFTTVHLKSC